MAIYSGLLLVLSIANWSLVCFICVGIFAVGMIWRSWKGVSPARP